MWLGVWTKFKDLSYNDFSYSVGIQKILNKVTVNVQQWLILFFSKKLIFFKYFGLGLFFQCNGQSFLSKLTNEYNTLPRSSKQWQVLSSNSE